MNQKPIEITTRPSTNPYYVELLADPISGRSEWMASASRQHRGIWLVQVYGPAGRWSVETVYGPKADALAAARRLLVASVEEAREIEAAHAPAPVVEEDPKVVEPESVELSLTSAEADALAGILFRARLAYESDEKTYRRLAKEFGGVNDKNADYSAEQAKTSSAIGGKLLAATIAADVKANGWEDPAIDEPAGDVVEWTPAEDDVRETLTFTDERKAHAESETYPGSSLVAGGPRPGQYTFDAPASEVGETARRKYLGVKRQNYCTFPTEDVRVLSAHHCDDCGEEIVWATLRRTVPWSGYQHNVSGWIHKGATPVLTDAYPYMAEEYPADARVAAHRPRARLSCSYCGTEDPVKYVQASYSDETRCTRCGGTDGWAIGD